ncbi:hypothetical protein BDW60DRAFT_183068 [Aspergillus nidulans var. acristatus]
MNDCLANGHCTGDVTFFTTTRPWAHSERSTSSAITTKARSGAATVHHQILRGRDEPTTHTPVLEMVLCGFVHLSGRRVMGDPLLMGVACRVI